MKNKKVRFIRKRGRIIPISVKNEITAAKSIASSKNSGDFAKIGGAAAASMGVLFAAGRIQRKSNALLRVKKFGLSSKVNRLAKITKFGGVAIAGLIAGSALTAIDKRSKDEKSRFLNLGSQSTSAIGIAAQIGVGFAAFRFGKRFESAGKRGLNLFKIKDIKKLKTVRDL